MMNSAKDTIHGGMVRRLVSTLFSGRSVRHLLRAFLTFSVVAAMAMALSPAKAYAAVPEVRTPLHAGVEVPSPLAVFGSNIVFGTHRSTNGGATWTTDPALTGPTWSYTGNGKLVGFTWAASGSFAAVVYTVATGKTQTYPLPSFPQSMNETFALFSTETGFVAYNFVTGQQSPVADPPTNATPLSSWPQLTSFGGLLWTGFSETGLMYAVAATPTAAPSDWVMIEDSGYVFTATQFVYAHNDGSNALVCARSLTDFTAAPTCVVAWAGLAPWTYSSSLFSFGATTVVDFSTWNGTAFVGRTFSWNGSALKRLTLPVGATISQPAAAGYGSPYGDTPYLVLRDANTVPSVMKVAPNGKLQKGFSLPKTSAASLTFLAVAPDRVVGGDTRDGSWATPSWVRSVSGSGFGAEKLLSVRASLLLASAGRTAVSGPAGLTIYDRGAVKTTLPDARLNQLSGPYLSRIGYNVAADRSQIEISTVTGEPIKNILGTSGALFGSEYVAWTSYTSPITVTVDDLTGVAPQRSVQLAGDTLNCGGGQVWGDKFYMACNNQVRMFSLTDGSLLASISATGMWVYYSLGTVGDGYAVVTTDNVVFSVWDVATGTLTPLTGCTYQTVSDGVGHLGCSTGTELVWRDFSSLSKSAPYLLGAMADTSVSFATSESWPLALDTTKALKAGTVVISNASGSVVKSLPFAASIDGSVRVAWNGLDTNGRPAPVGTYTYKLVSAGADGSGSVVSITGTGTASGTVTVTAPVCQGRGCHR